MLSRQQGSSIAMFRRRILLLYFLETVYPWRDKYLYKSLEFLINKIQNYLHMYSGKIQKTFKNKGGLPHILRPMPCRLTWPVENPSGNRLVIKFKSVSIYHKHDLSIVNCFNFYSSIVIYSVYLVRAQPAGGKFFFEGFESGIKQQSPNTRLEVFLLNEFVMPLAPLVLD